MALDNRELCSDVDSAVLIRKHQGYGPRLRQLNFVGLSPISARGTGLDDRLAKARGAATPHKKRPRPIPRQPLEELLESRFSGAPHVPLAH